MEKQANIITVITVVYNGKAYIEDTIKSVLSQTYPHIEYIIIDGGSTDGTVDIIRQYADRISYWISEADKGVYDAMNKGIAKATGKWINFMNAGDTFYSPDSVQQFFSKSEDLEPYAIVYGDAEFRLKNIAYIIQSDNNCNRERFMPFSHQASFIRADIAKSTMFELSYRIAADSALSLRLLAEGHKFNYVPVVVCLYDATQGLSAENEVDRSKELFAMQIKYNDVSPDAPYFKEYIKRARRQQRLRRLIPSCLWTKMREYAVKKKYPKYRKLNA